jgi:amino acid permease
MVILDIGKRQKQLLLDHKKYNTSYMKKNGRKDEAPLVQHLGIFRRPMSLWEGVGLIVSSTIGAGILGIPYAIAQVGVGIGVLYIVGLGILLVGLNLLLGEVVIRTRQSFQLSGLARKYLGRVGEYIMTGMVYSATFAVLVIYIIGEGETLAELFGGSAFFWSTIFFVIGGCLIVVGMRTIKLVEMILTVGIIAVVILIVAWTAPHISWPHIQYTNLANIFFPYGVILFAYSGTASIPEAYTLLKHDKTLFKQAIVIAGGISMVIYLLFALMVVGVTGGATTEIATIGLGEALGTPMFLLGNIFAVLAMGTSFLVIGLSLRDSLSWDYSVRKSIASFLVIVIPFIIFILGLREFIAIMDFVGGVFISLTMFLVILIYWRAKQKGDLPVGKYRLHHTTLLIALLVLALTGGALYSIIKLF